MLKKIKSILIRPREEQMMWTMFALPLVFLPLIYSLTPNSFYESGIFQWSKVIEYYIELLSAVGSVFLGLIAILQTQKLQKLEENADNRANSCNIYIENGKINPTDEFFGADNTTILKYSGDGKYESSFDYIAIYIENYSDAFLKEIDIFFDKIRFHTNLTIVKDKKEIYMIRIPKSLKPETECDCKLVFTSCYNVKTYGSFKIIPLVETNEGYDQIFIYGYNFYGTEQPK